MVKENSKGDLVYASFLDERKGVQYDDIWTEFTYAENLNLYSTQKPQSLIHHIVKTSSNRGDVVADFFCGSGTTLAVANDLGRNFFGCDINPKAVEISRSRIKTSLFSAA